MTEIGDYVYKYFSYDNDMGRYSYVQVHFDTIDKEVAAKIIEAIGYGWNHALAHEMLYLIAWDRDYVSEVLHDNEEDEAKEKLKTVFKCEKIKTMDDLPKTTDLEDWNEAEGAVFVRDLVGDD